MKKKNFFWIGYSDLMTSLFFLMLILFVVAYKKYEVDQKMLQEIKNVEKALGTLDQKYFEFDEINKRYRLKININFKGNSANIYDNTITDAQRAELLSAGKHLYDMIRNITDEYNEVDYLLIIEGNTQRYNNNFIHIPNIGYELSYKRALALYNFWKDHEIDFRDLAPQCEVILAGSGYFGQSRDTINENNNRRFTIQITSKVGKFLKEKEKK